MLPSSPDPIFDSEFRLRPRPSPIAADLRISWGVALVVLMIGNCRGKRASLPKLHLLAHAARTKQGRSDLISYVESPYKNYSPAIRFEPWLNRALAFATAQGLVTIIGGKAAKLASPGSTLLVELRKSADLMRDESDFATICARKISEGDVKQFLSARV